MAQSKTTVMTVVKKNATVVPKKANSSNRKKPRRQNRSKRGSAVAKSQSLSDIERRHFFNALMYPDIVGPIRIPRCGYAAKTGLSGAKGLTLIGFTSVHQMVVWSNSSPQDNLAMETWTSTGPNNPWSLGAPVSNSISFPVASNQATYNWTGGCLVASYVGAPLNCTGEVVFGTIPYIASRDLTSSSPATLSLYPGTVRMPLADIIGKPLRVSARKISPEADNFKDTTSYVQDWEVPFIFVTNTTSANTVRIFSTKNGEYTSSTNQDYVVPFESHSNSAQIDAGALMDASNDMGKLFTTVTPGLLDDMIDSVRSSAARFNGRIGNDMVDILTNYGLDSLHGTMAHTFSKPQHLAETFRR
jgi:hypothetical protein